ncbi:MAG TPA: high-potential iron-sulfur protein [Caulobacteraceae bacterium]|nr:high-potential iron-sulfur protein [Caulobacteraceae bacterium]
MSDGPFHSLRISRRGFLGAAALTSGAALLGATPAAAGSKFSQTMAKYQPTPKGAQRCDGCTQFQGPDACKVVEGKIAASGWCLLYAKK